MDNIAKWLCSKVQETSKLPLVSIIMPVHDRESLVGKAISSVLSQSYEGLNSL